MCGIFAFFRRHFQVKYITLYFTYVKSVVCDAKTIPAISRIKWKIHHLKTYNLSFFFEKKETKKPVLCHLSKRGFCSRARLKISKGQVVFFEKTAQKISTFKPLPIFILSAVVCVPTAVLSKTKNWLAVGYPV